MRAPSYARAMANSTEATSITRAERRERATAETRATILSAARTCLLAEGYANLTTRRVAETASVPLSQIHYHFGSKQQLILAVLAAENERLLSRQRALFGGPEPLWQQWERACDYLDDDLASGYVRILHEMIAAGWSDEAVAEQVRAYLGGWFALLADVADRVAHRIGGLGAFTPAEMAALMALPFLGAESAILVGFDESEVPARASLRKVGAIIRRLEQGTTA